MLSIKMPFFNRIHRQFFILVGIFLFVTVTLHLLTTREENIWKSFTLPPNFRILDYLSDNNTTNVLSSKELSKRVWARNSMDDKIVYQLQFKPLVDNELPPKRILVQKGTSGWGIPQGKKLFKNEECSVTNCELMDSPLDGELYDARIFKETMMVSDMLNQWLSETPRTNEQVWIMFALECPEATPRFVEFNNVINWTATYRLDSTIVTPYDKWVPHESFTSLTSIELKQNFASGKTKFGAIFVSNCQSSNNRLEYINELKEYIDLDVYGSCGTMNCERYEQDECFEMLRKDYKFYFSFENANCRDYITEKLFLNALRHDVLPVVMGAHPEDYKRVAPPGSYIHVEDFKSPKHLADYLLKLNSDHEEYNKYFLWKNAGHFIDTKFWCRICSMLWDPDRPSSMSVKNLAEWWRQPNTCIGSKQWKDIE